MTRKFTLLTALFLITAGVASTAVAAPGDATLAFATGATPPGACLSTAPNASECHQAINDTLEAAEAAVKADAAEATAPLASALADAQSCTLPDPRRCAPDNMDGYAMIIELPTATGDFTGTGLPTNGYDHAVQVTDDGQYVKFQVSVHHYGLGDDMGDCEGDACSAPVLKADHRIPVAMNGDVPRHWSLQLFDLASTAGTDTGDGSGPIEFYGADSGSGGLIAPGGCSPDCWTISVPKGVLPADGTGFGAWAFIDVDDSVDATPTGTDPASGYYNILKAMFAEDARADQLDYVPTMLTYVPSDQTASDPCDDGDMANNDGCVPCMGDLSDGCPGPGTADPESLADQVETVGQGLCTIPVLGGYFANLMGANCTVPDQATLAANIASAGAQAAAAANETAEDVQGQIADGFTAHITPAMGDGVLKAIDGHYEFTVASYLHDGVDAYVAETAFGDEGFFLRIDHYAMDGTSGSTLTHYQGTFADGVWTVKVPISDLPTAAMLDVFAERYNSGGSDGRSSHYHVAKEALVNQSMFAAADALDGAGIDGEAKLFTPLFVGDPIATVANVVGSITDADGDGVIDAADECPATPDGAAVDEAGCADSQKDSDVDGVSDDLDACPDTEAEAEVDADGCADAQKDTDGDLVTDDADLCPDTPDGAKVDDDGCADSQRDSDVDGVTDDLDLCPGTADGATVDADGCADSQKDADGDAVMDDADLCPDTADGAAVDADGCADAQKDTDGDFVMDDADLCPDTAADATVDADGCADEQKDTDGDLVTDDADECPGSASGTAVDARGCAADQRDTDGDFVMDDRDACPDTAAGATADASGCSAAQKDSDGDGVKDDADTCHNTPPGTAVGNDGCALPTQNDPVNDDATDDTADDADDADVADDATTEAEVESDDGSADDTSNATADTDADQPASETAADVKVNTPGFGLLAALVALGAILIARRRD